jgi:hypothetical protein
MINVAKGKHEIKSTTIYLEQVATELASSINNSPLRKQVSTDIKNL